MAGMDMILQQAVNLLIAKLPPEAIEKVGQLAQTGIELKEQLDRIEAGQKQTVLVLLALVELLKTLRTEKGIDHERPEQQSGEQPPERASLPHTAFP